MKMIGHLLYFSHIYNRGHKMTLEDNIKIIMKTSGSSV